MSFPSPIGAPPAGPRNSRGARLGGRKAGGGTAMTQQMVAQTSPSQIPSYPNQLLPAQGASDAHPQTRDVEAEKAEYQKQVVHKLLDTLEQEELLRLASVLRSRGLIRATPDGALQVVPRSTPADLQGSGQHRPLTRLEPNPQDPTLQDGSLAPAPQTAEASPYPAILAEEQPNTPTGMLSGSGFGEGEVHEQTSEVNERTATTLILRNLPTNFDQQLTQEWVDSKGYRDLYDFLLWFPAKKTSRLNTSSYAFVNFSSAEYAQRFRQDHHLARFPGQDTSEGRSRQAWPLSIALAKVQGFQGNYVRFHHLTDAGSPTLCQPFFARDSCESLPEDVKSQAAAAATTAPHADIPPEGPCSTLIIRNLPYSVDSLEVARDWLDNAGFGGAYDFFLFLPAKRRRPESTTPGGPPQGLGYAFVNFKANDLAAKCAESLNGRTLAEGDPVLNVVSARVQGLEACVSHFSTLGENGRVIPWVDPTASQTTPQTPQTPPSTRPATRQYQ